MCGSIAGLRRHPRTVRISAQQWVPGFTARCDTVVDNAWTVLDGAANLDVGCVSHVNLVSDRAVFDQVRQAVTG
jgi:hypothetical protein